MTREEKIKKILEAELECEWKSLQKTLTDVLANGFKGYANMTDEELDEHYRVWAD